MQSTPEPATSLLSNYCNKCFLSFILKRKGIELANVSYSLNPYPSTCYMNLDKLFSFAEPQISRGDDTSIYITEGLGLNELKHGIT